MNDPMNRVFQDIDELNHYLFWIPNQDLLKLLYEGVPSCTAIKKVYGSLKAYEDYMNRYSIT